MQKLVSAIFFSLFICPALSAQMHFHKKEVIGSNTCIQSNGVPEHDIGKFPNRANPNELIEQNLTFCFPSIPQLTETVTWGLMTVGVTLSGIPLRPYTAEYYDNTSKRGFSRNPASGWRKQAMHEPKRLGIDFQNGHVDRSGLYHYHGISRRILEDGRRVLIGYAPDGFKIIYNPDNITSSWQLKSGKRVLPPGGNYDGQFEEDFEYVLQSGSLDECNGMKIKDSYAYFATTSYPFFPRCFKGKVSEDFIIRN